MTVTDRRRVVAQALATHHRTPLVPWHLVDRVLSPSRRTRDVELRRAVIVQLRTDGHTLQSIAAVIGRHHTTVLHHLTVDARQAIEEGA